MADGVNNAVNIHVQNFILILETIARYAEGDFSLTLKPLPGKQNIANQKLNLMLK